MGLKKSSINFEVCIFFDSRLAGDGFGGGVGRRGLINGGGYEGIFYVAVRRF